MNDFTPLRFGVRQDQSSQGWHLEMAIPARKDQWDDAEDVVVRIGSSTYTNEADAMSDLESALSALLYG